MESMSVASGCSCIRRFIGFLILLIPIYILYCYIYIYSSCICSFLQQHPYFFKLFSFLFMLFLCNFILKNYC